jgi:hypothetical protein
MNRALSVRVRAAAAGPWQAALAPGARAGGAMVGPKHGDCEGPWRARTVPFVPAKQPRWCNHETAPLESAAAEGPLRALRPCRECCERPTAQEQGSVSLQ